MAELLMDAHDAAASPRLRRLEREDAQQLCRLLAHSPVVNCFPASRVDIALVPNASSHFLGWFDVDERLTSATYVGGNVAPIATTTLSRMAFAERLMSYSRRPASLVGPAAEVLDLWRMLEPAWGAAREVRATQHLLVCSDVPDAIASAPVRLANSSDFELLMPACIAMFTEELGVSPLSQGMHSAYHARIRELIGLGRSYLMIEDGDIAFKAEVGAAADGVAQVQGVWVKPSLRGRGYGVAGIASVARALLDSGYHTVSLYTNDFNRRALSVYTAAGFEPHATFATVLR